MTTDGSSAGHDSPNAVAYKVMSILILFSFALGSGVVPLVIPKARNLGLILSLANVFAAGVFLTMGLCHLLPEAVENLGEAYGEEPAEKYRIGFMICIVGYTLILAVQKVVPIARLHDILPHSHGDDHGPSSSRQNGQRRSGSPVRRLSNTRGENENEASALLVQPTADQENGGKLPAQTADNDDDSDMESPSHVRRSSARLVASFARAADGSHAGVQQQVRSYALVMALLLHSFAAGAALGVQTEAKRVIQLFIALVAHKWAEGLTLGISIAKAPSLQKWKLQLIILTVFSIGTPTGIAIGWIAEAAFPPSATGYLMGLSAGTFLYIGASEVVAEEFASSHHGLYKLLLFILGVMVIFLSTAFADAD